MDAETIAAGLLREALDCGRLSLATVEAQLGAAVSRILHDSVKVRHLSGTAECLDDATAAEIRNFCLGFHDPRAILVQLAATLDSMRHLAALPRWQQQVLALESMQIWAPMAHSLGTGSMLWELEDIAFRRLFPESYKSMEQWLQGHWADPQSVVEGCRLRLREALEGDAVMQQLAQSVSVLGRCKSLYSTMKKLIRDGRKRQQVFDILGLRVIIVPKAGGGLVEETRRGEEVCYRARQVALALWSEIPERSKDYIRDPKGNGYQSLHSAVYLDAFESSPPLELQIRTEGMDLLAVHGAAAHGAYKGGLTDTQQVCTNCRFEGYKGI